jgi:replicative DNA helicase
LYANIDAERDILLSIILFPDEYSIYVKSLEEKDFTLEYHKNIFKAIKKLVDDGKKVDVLFLSKDIPDIAQFVESAPVPAVSSIEDYIKELKEQKIKRDLERLAVGIDRSLKKGAKVEKILSSITKYIQNLDIETEAELLKDIAMRVYMELEQESKNKDKRVRLSLQPISDLARKGEMTVIGARPGTGKTAFALKIAYDLAKEGKTVYFISREMTGEQITKRLFAKISRINAEKFIKATLEEQDWTKLADVLTELSVLKILVDSKTNYVEDLYLKVAARKDIDCVIIDYLQLLQTREKAQTRDREIGIITRTLKMMNLDLNIPIFVLSQLNREGTKEPTLANLRESGNIEQDFDNVIFLHNKEEEKDEEAKEESETLEKVGMRKMKLIIAKQRNGKIGKYDIFFEPEFMEFYDVLR